MVEQFQVKFIARSTAVSSWLTRVHGLTKADIDARDGDPDYILVQMLVEEANTKDTMLSAAEPWGPKGKQDVDAAPVGLYTKAELNLLVQKQVSAAVKQFQSKCPTKAMSLPKKTIQTTNATKVTRRCHGFKSRHGKQSLLHLVHPKQKLSIENVGTGANIVVFGSFLMAL